MKAAIARYGRTPTENQRRQAFLPLSAIAISNPVGTAPAFILETALGAVISLPGVPREMELLLHEAVIPYLQQGFMLRDIIKVLQRRHPNAHLVIRPTRVQGEGAAEASTCGRTQRWHQRAR